MFDPKVGVAAVGVLLWAVGAVAGAGEVRQPDCADPAALRFDTAPVFLDSVPPEYPLAALRARVEGDVRLAVVVLPSGEPCAAHALDDIDPLLRIPAQCAALRSRFRPATRDGVPVTGSREVVYRFRWAEQELRTAWPPLPEGGPRVSEIGRAVRRVAAGDESYVEYELEGLRVQGDLPVEDLRGILAQIETGVAPGETVVAVTHFLALPPSAQPRFQWEWELEGDLQVVVCLDEMVDGRCHMQRIFVFRNRDGEYVLEGSHEREWL